MPDIPAQLAACDLFSGIPPDVISAVAARAHMLVATRGQILFVKGDPATTLYIVSDGLVRLSLLSADGKSVTLRLAGPGDTIGETAMLDGGGRMVDATALSESRLIALEKRDFLPLTRTCPELFQRLSERVCRRLRSIISQFEELTFVPAPARLARALIRFAMARRVEPAKGARIAVTQQELAEATGLSRESTNRILNGWESDGVLRLEKGEIVLGEPSALRQRAREFAHPPS